MKPYKFTFIDTGGHGYYVVPKVIFLKLGGDPDKISRFSGHDTLNLYLEEDSDASYFFGLLKDNSISFEFKSTYNLKFAKTHNYTPELFHFTISNGARVRLKNGTPATVVSDGNRFLLKTDTNLYRLPRNLFSYINPF